ncbi:PadR family transcriptional regulator [Devosia sp. YIM 151766]|uniref:PadR family transcriptional regulator n=1 Tax=Devosia sp. YIM 151766 TaxID=3017325 RepID=UPI00255C9B9F|nr:PadR family transcriptional regulator [Devosia sp. YIM 151766]WIY53751.1 PadR family transcriptional regulator [Devosia sp. YIM 151766]
MNVKTLCLSILYYGEASGYDIRRLCTEEEFAYFVEASFGSIYPALARLEEEGCVTSRTEQQTGKPARKVYSITETGRRIFAEELAEPLGEDIFRSPFLLFARFAHILPPDLVEQRCNEFLARTVKSRQRLDEAAAREGRNPTDRWIIDYGRAVMEVAEAHMRTHMHELVTMARAEPRKDAAE